MAGKPRGPRSLTGAERQAAFRKRVTVRRVTLIDEIAASLLRIRDDIRSVHEARDVAALAYNRIRNAKIRNRP